MNYVFPYDNIIIGILVLIIGFGLHWIGQLLSVINWQFATKIGIQEANLPAEYKVYEHAIAVADSLIGWIYGFAGVGLILNLSWGYKLAWFPGVIFLYHGLSFWFWTGNQNKAGHKLFSDGLRIGWSLVNFISGILTVLIAWNAY